jgi:phosphoglycerate dehydrogenase-like enzyme
MRIVKTDGASRSTTRIVQGSQGSTSRTNVPDSNITVVAATHAVALALALTRRLHRHDRSIRSGQWDFEGPGAGIRRVSSQVFGLIGFGKIGQRVAARTQVLPRGRRSSHES